MSNIKTFRQFLTVSEEALTPDAQFTQTSLLKTIAENPAWPTLVSALKTLNRAKHLMWSEQGKTRQTLNWGSTKGPGYDVGLSICSWSTRVKLVGANGQKLNEIASKLKEAGCRVIGKDELDYADLAAEAITETLSQIIKTYAL